MDANPKLVGRSDVLGGDDPGPGAGCLGSFLIGAAFWIALAGWLVGFGVLMRAFYGIAFVLLALGVGVWVKGAR